MDEAYVLDLIARNRHLERQRQEVRFAEAVRGFYILDELEPAAARIFAAIDAALAPLEGTRLGGRLGEEVARARTRTLSVLGAREPQRRLAPAKAVQLRVAPRPLAVCRDDGDWRDRGFGCLSVFRDSASTRGPRPFRDLCDRCRVNDQRRRELDAHRRLAGWESGKEEVVVGFDEAGLPRLGWSAECRACGRTFPARGVNDARCPECNGRGDE